MQGNGDNDIDRYCSDVIKEVDEFVVYTFDHEEATDYQRMAFDDPTIAGNFKQGSNMLTSLQRKIVDDLTRPASFLDRMVEAEEAGGKRNLPAVSNNGDGDLVQPMPPTDMMFGMPVDEFEKKFKKIKKKFKQKRTEFEDKAKNALLEAAKLYLGDQHSAAYNKYKMELDKAGLSGIMYQMHTMQSALDAISARIQAAGSALSPRDIDSFVGLQRVMLDTQKFQFEYMQSIETSMKELKADLELAEHGKPAGQTESDNIFFFKGPKEFLTQLKEFKNTMNDFVPTASKNKKLNPNAEVVDIAHEESVSAALEGEDSSKARSPFGGYEGSRKRPKKRNEDGEELEDDGGEFDI